MIQRTTPPTQQARTLTGTCASDLGACDAAQPHDASARARGSAPAAFRIVCAQCRTVVLLPFDAELSALLDQLLFLEEHHPALLQDLVGRYQRLGLRRLRQSPLDTLTDSGLWCDNLLLKRAIAQRDATIRQQARLIAALKHVLTPSEALRVSLEVA